MLQTINIIGNMKNGTKKFLAVANIIRYAGITGRNSGGI